MTFKQHLNNILRGIKARGATKRELARIKRAFLDTDYRCFYCGEPITYSYQISIDHKQPVSRGGTHAVSNLAACCKHCNMAKGDMTEKEFKDLLIVCNSFGDGGKRLLSRLVAAGNVFRRRFRWK